jgi:hypothetical protein
VLRSSITILASSVLEGIGALVWWDHADAQRG